MVNPRQFEVTEEVLRVLLARPGYRPFSIFYRRGKLHAALEETNRPVIRPAFRAAYHYRLYQVGVHFDPEELERVLAAGAADTTAGRFVGDFSTFVLVGAYAADRGDWDEFALALKRQRARTGSTWTKAIP